MKTLAVIGGTGLNAWGEPEQELQCETPYGNSSGPVSVHSFDNARLLFLPRHGPGHRIAPHDVNYRANIWALREAGAGEILAVNAVGGIGEGMDPGALVLPDQLIDYTWGRQHSYSSGVDSELKHIDFTRPFSSKLRAESSWAAKMAGISLVEGGCIGVTQGPRLETAAEVLRLERDGCQLVGMTTMPEAALAAELGLEYAVIAMVVNQAAGKGAGVVDLETVERNAADASTRVRSLLEVMLSGPGQAARSIT